LLALATQPLSALKRQAMGAKSNSPLPCRTMQLVDAVNVRHAVWVFRDDCKYLTWSGRPLRSGRSARPLRERIKAREGKEALANLVPNRFMPPTAIADAYWQIYHQPRSAWVFEREIRPFGESGEGARGPFKVVEAQEERLWLVP